MTDALQWKMGEHKSDIRSSGCCIILAMYRPALRWIGQHILDKHVATICCVGIHSGEELNQSQVWTSTMDAQGCIAMQATQCRPAAMLPDASRKSDPR